MNFSQSTIFNVFASMGLMLINVVIGIISARVLGPEELGRFNIFLTTQTLFITIFALGIGQSCIYFINSLRIDKRALLSKSVSAMIPISLVASILFFILLISFSDYFGDLKKSYLLLFSLGTYALLINSIFTPVLLVDMQVFKSQVVKYSSRIITLVAISLILLLKIDLNVGVLISLAGLTNVISLFILFSYFRDSISFRNMIDGKLFKKVLVWGVKFSGSNIASVILTNIPVYFLSWFSISDKFANVGYYTRASTLLVVGTVISSSIGPLLFSKWSKINGIELKNNIKKTSMLLFLINLLISLALIIFSSFIIPLLYGKDFVIAIPVLRVLALTLVFNGLKEICYSILSSQGVPIRILNNLFISIILLGIVLVILIPKYGLIGCSWGTLIVSAVSAFLLMLDTTKVSLIKMADFFVLPTKSELIVLVKNIMHR